MWIVSITGNLITNSGLSGISLSADMHDNGSAVFTVRDNVIKDNDTGVIVGAGWGGGPSEPGGGGCRYASDYRGVSTSHQVLIDDNSIVGNGSAIQSCFDGNVSITNNRIHDNGSESTDSVISIHYADPYSVDDSPETVTLDNNSIYNNQGTNTLFIPTSLAFLLRADSSHSITGNNFSGNNTTYDVRHADTYQSGETPLFLNNNWWGTTNDTEIQARIFDWNDDVSYNFIDYTPFLTAPNTTAPPSPPTNVAAQTGPTSISLAWSANPDCSR